MDNHIRKSRLVSVSLILIFLLSFLLTRLAWIQLFRYQSLSKLAKSQHYVTVELPPERGVILDRNSRALADSLDVDSIYAVSRDIKEKTFVAKKLSKILDIQESFIYDRLNRNKGFVWIARKISKEKADLVSGLKLKGIVLTKEPKRFYPAGSLASHVIGFAGLDNVGLEGFELTCDNYLKGSSGWQTQARDAKQRQLSALETVFVPPKDGYDIVLTIDQTIQHIAEKELDKAYKDFNAKAATIIVMDPYNGDILALANRPAYDLNSFDSASADSRRNRAITDVFEPGSAFKIVTAAAVLEENKVDEKKKIFCENGEYLVAGHILHDHRPHGWLTFEEVIEQSSNIGTVKAAQILGQNDLYRYIRKFGFGELTGIDMPGEISGIVRPLNKWSGYSITAIPMGQEIGITAIQLACTISTIANGGLLVKPRILSFIKDKHNEIIKSFKPQIKRRVISEGTASRLKNILRGVVEEGTGKLAKIGGFSAAGKTGTSQKLEPNGQYSHTRFIASFIGFAPVTRPVISIVVILDEPHPFYYGGVVAAPVFSKVANATLRYLRIPPTEEFVLEKIPLNREITAKTQNSHQ